MHYGTDKSSDGHGYTRLYERFLGPVRYKSMVLLELGVWEGASILMWQQYLPNSQIVGVDRSDITIDTPRVTIWKSDQAADGLGAKIQRRFGDVDVIIDDASHISSKTIQSFKNLYPHLRSGGLYVIEDLQTSYDEKNYPNDACPDPDGAHRGGAAPGGQVTAMNFCKRLADEVNSNEFPKEHRLGYDLESVQFYQNICFISKRC